jgi:hypothetical protein
MSCEWKAIGLSNPNPLLAEYHGRTIRTSEEPGYMMLYNNGRGDLPKGDLLALFDGIHGWYFLNANYTDIRVILSLSGFCLIL